MRVLGIDTSTYYGSVAFTDDDSVLGEINLNIGPSHSERLLPAIGWLLASIGRDRNEIEGISVSRGPGSFTALRIGISTAKGIAFSLGVPIAGVSSLEVLALNLAFPSYTVCSLIDARKKEVYASFFRYSRNKFDRLTEDMLITPQELIDKVSEETIFIGDGVTHYRGLIEDALGDWALFCPSSLNFPRASNCAKLGISILDGRSFSSIDEIHPHYLKKSVAEILKEG
jgi:tRNA threonylcarbamoyladenosine biosynthesis protein TsaB